MEDLLKWGLVLMDEDVLGKGNGYGSLGGAAAGMKSS